MGLSELSFGCSTLNQYLGRIKKNEVTSSGGQNFPDFLFIYAAFIRVRHRDLS